MFSKKHVFTLVAACAIGLSSVAIITAEPVFAQEEPIEDVEAVAILEGTVVDSETQEELSGVTIEIVELDQETESDTNGEFYVENLKKGKAYTITASLEGYEDYEQTIMSEAQPLSESNDLSWTIEIELEPVTDEK